MKEKAIIIVLTAALLFTASTAAPEVPDVLTETGAQLLNISGCIEKGLEVNPDVVRAAEDVKKSERYLMEKFAAFLPKVFLTYQFIRTSSPGIRRIASDDFLYAESIGAVRIEKDIFKGGEDYYTYNSARMNLHRSREAYLAAKKKLVYELKTAFYDLLLAQSLLNIKTDAKNRMETYTAKIAKKNMVGEVRKYELLRSKVEVQGLESDIMALKKEEIRLAAKLKELLMMEAVPRIEIAGTLLVSDAQFERDYPLNLTLEMARNNNHDLKTARFRQKTQKETVKAAASKYAPAFSIKSAFYKSSDDFNLMSRYYYDWSLLLLINVPIFDGFKTASLVAQEKYEHAKTITTEASVEERVVQELKAAVDNLAETREDIRAQKGLVNTARDALNLIWVLYERNEASQWDVIDANTNYTRAEARLLTSLRDHHLLMAKIENLT
ncbi:MAG: TolC family protein [Candidatus Omnitrophota bacterium]